MRKRKTEDSRNGAVIYGRVSTVEQAEGFSLGIQERAGRDCCEANSWEVFKCFEDAGRTATNTNRSGFHEAIACAIRNKHTVRRFLVYRWDRFARNVADHEAVRLRLKKHGIELVSVMEGRADESPSGKLAHDVGVAIAEYESACISERAKEGMLESRRAGNLTSQPPQGLMRVMTDSGKTKVVLDPDRAPLLTEAFQMFAEGSHTQKEVAEYLDRCGYRTPQGVRITVSHVNKILRNRTYTGFVHVSEEEGWIPGNHPAVTDVETFDRCQAIIEARRYSPRRYQLNNPVYPLRRFLRCGHCGLSITGGDSEGRHGGKYQYYACRRSRSCVRVRRRTLHQEFKGLLKGFTPTRQFLSFIRELMKRVLQSTAERLQKELSAIKRQLSRRRRRRNQLIDAFVHEKTIDESVYRERLSQLDDLIEELERQQDQLIQKKEHSETFMEASVNGLRSLGTNWESQTYNQQWNLQRALFPRGLEYTREGGFMKSAVPIGFVDT